MASGTASPPALDRASTPGGQADAPWHLQFVLLAAIWGSSFVCIKVLGEDWTPAQVAFGRIALGAGTLLAVIGVRRERLPRGARLWGHLAVVGLLMNALPFTLFAIGERHVPSVVAGLWNATTPLWAILGAFLLLGDERPGRRRLIALGVGFLGVVCVLGPWRGLGGGELLGQLACAGGGVCYGFGLPYTRRHLAGRPESGPALAAGQLLCATAMLAVVVPFDGLPATELGADAVASLLVLGLLGSGLAYVLTYSIVRAAGATTFSTVTYVIPVFSTALGVLLLSEPLHLNEPLGAAIVLGATAWGSRATRARG